MAETFFLGESKLRSGVFFRRERGDVDIASATYGVVAAVFQADFGPLNSVKDFAVSETNDLEKFYGENAATFLKEIFKGGAKTLRCVRVGGIDGKEASITLKTSDADPKDAVTITTRFVGTKEFDVSILDNLVDSQKKILRFSVNNVVFSQFEFEKSDDESAAIVELLKTDRFFIAKKKNAGAVALIDQVAMTGGQNPSAATIADYTAAFAALERYRWNCVVVDSNNIQVHSVMREFVSRSYETGRLGMCVIGGTRDIDLDTRMKRARAYNSEQTVYVLNGWFDIEGVEYEGYMAAARIAGMIAGSETNSSITHLAIEGALELNQDLSNGDYNRAVQYGCLAISLNDDDVPIIDNAINTLVTLKNDTDRGWTKIRRVRERYELMERENRTCDALVGRLNNDSNGRATLLAAMQGVINQMIAEGKLFTGSYVTLDPRYTPQADYAHFLFVIGDIDSLEKIYLTYRFSWTNPFSALEEG